METMMNMLSGDIFIQEILTKLPIIDLMKYRYGSHSSIVHKLIMGKIFGHDDRESGVIMIQTKADVFYLSYGGGGDDYLHDAALPSFDNNNKGFPLEFARILGSVDGIVLLLCTWNGDLYNPLTMWNPSTNSTKLINPFTKPYSFNNSLGDCCLWEDNFACGFCPQLVLISIRNYMYSSAIINASNQRDPCLHPDYVVEVFSLVTDSWRRIEVDAHLFSQFPPDESSFWPQVGYPTKDTFTWLVIRYSSPTFLAKLLTFHRTTELFQVTSLPDAIVGGAYDYSVPPDEQDRQHSSPIQLSNGTIALVIPNLPSSSFDVWVLLEYGVADSWIKLCTTGPFPGVRQILRFLKNGKMLMESTSGELLLGDLVSNKVVQNLQIKGRPGDSQIIFHEEIPFVLK